MVCVTINIMYRSKKDTVHLFPSIILGLVCNTSFMRAKTCEMFAGKSLVPGNHFMGMWRGVRLCPLEKRQKTTR